MRPVILLMMLALGAAAPGLPTSRGGTLLAESPAPPLPYVLNINIRRGGFVARGVVPGEVLAALEAEGVQGPRRLEGPPAPDWDRAALAGVAGLRLLMVGQLELRDRLLSILGTARTPVEAEALRRAVLAALPTGYEAHFTLAVADDLTPPAYRLTYAVETGVTLSGKLPVGIGAADVARALGIADLDDGSETALEGAPGTLAPAVAVLRDWLPRVETLDLSVTEAGSALTLGLGRGWDPEAVRAALAPALPGVTLTVDAVFARGERRLRALAGGVEVQSAGFWLPDVPGGPDCRTGAEAALPGALSPAPPGVNALAGALRSCLAAGEEVVLSGAPGLAALLRQRLPDAAINEGPGQGAPALVWSRP